MTFTMEENRKEQRLSIDAAKRRDWKSKARKVVKTHYVILVMLCLVSVFFGTEFSYVTSHTTDTYNFLTGQDPVGTGIKVRIDGKYYKRAKPEPNRYRWPEARSCPK